MAPGNPVGAVVIWDGENPRTFTGKAREAISGGEFVFCSGVSTVGSLASSYVTSDIGVALTADAYRFNGIALHNAGSNSNITVATRGAYLLKCGGSVLCGTVVETIGDAVAVQSITSGAVPSALYAGVSAGKAIGRAITEGASGGYALIDISP